MALITLQDYKDYAGISNPKNDTKLEVIVNYVNAYVPTYCGRDFSATSGNVVTNKVLSNFGNTILSPEIPIISIQELRINGTAVDTADYIFDNDTGLIEVIGTTVQLPVQPYKVQLDYTHGYSEVPADIELACLELVTWMYKREFNKTRRSGGEQADYEVSDSDLPLQVKSILVSYRS